MLYVGDVGFFNVFFLLQHYELDKENLQMLALKLSCASNSLFKELLLEEDNCRKVKTQTLSDVHNIITTIKPLVCWLDRYVSLVGSFLKGPSCVSEHHFVETLITWILKQNY